MKEELNLGNIVYAQAYEHDIKMKLLSTSTNYIRFLIFY